mmetsp:Transcript_20771/g.63179  ORF Transcript_20771/g.63179 Transcript_20771/m.63179 type:complete len:190 (+) Transcript_20771:752-1321(+)
MEGVGSDIMAGVSLGLGRDERFFEKYYDRAFWVMRVLRYPLAPPAVGDQQGVGEHTDYGCLTLITADNAPGFDRCLQIRDMHKNDWVFVEPRDNCFIINIGDMLSHWVEGYRSTPHRVLSPQGHPDMPEAQAARGRVSVAYFFEPNFDAVITPLAAAEGAGRGSGEPVLYGEHLREKVTSNFNYGVAQG